MGESQVTNQNSNRQNGRKERIRRPGDLVVYRNLEKVGREGWLWLAVLALLLIYAAGCTTVAPAPRPVMVEVPVPSPVCCTAEQLPPPSLAIAALRSDSPPADTIRSYAASVIVLKSAVKQRDAILQACAAPAHTNPEK